MDRIKLSGLRWGSRVHFLLAWVLCVLALLLAAATWLPGPNRVPFAAVVFLCVAIFPVFGAAGLRAMGSEGRSALLGKWNGDRMGRFVLSLSIGLKCCYVAVFVVVLLALATAGAAQDAETDGHGGYYYTRYIKTERRSEQVALTEDEYHEARRAQTRTVAAVSAFFHAMSGFLVLVAASPEATRRVETELELASGTD
ncbi:hypothetical protein ACIOC2_17925 [Streptomyces sp. NPDC088337]|uniref:hypothetical protein n=1 Tax=unclassified Streptomyces TaxID=2593676 RepID=UPI002DDABDFD|nr:hypothetical protein [Streptomyces sp. NBC_01788]WSB27256.1 hypothetical protein OIE49_15935 [Streptomyces sp. NBC_01788]